MRRTKKNANHRLGICFCGFLLLYVGLSVRTVQLQLLSDPRVSDLQKRQEFRNLTFTSPRGMIYDRNGRALSVSVQMPSVFMDPSHTEISSKQVSELASVLGVSPASIRSKAKNKERQFQWLARKISPQSEKKIQNLGIKGVYVLHEWDRMYPDREILAQTLGFVGTDGNGLEGLEKQYDSFLQTQPLLITSTKDARGRSIFTDQQVHFEPEKALNLELTIDSTVQYLLEKELKHAATNHNVQSGMGIVMNPNTGEILAMASYPSANPNRLTHFSQQDWKNRPIQTSFEPGSIFKIFVMAGALEFGLVHPGDIFHCEEGSLRFGQKTIRNPVKKAWLDPQGILKFSNNVGIARIGLDMGQEKMVSIIEDFGFTKKTAIDFPGEQSGYLDKSQQWVPTKTANLAFGQGIAVTGIQIAQGLSVIANGGYLIRPYVVSKASTTTGKEIFSHHPSLRPKKILSDSTIEYMKQWMEAVTDPDGTGHKAKLEGYRTAGKTGTAQIYDQEKHEYSNTQVVSSFIGFAPVSSPELVTVISFYNPKDSEFGGTIAAPVFKHVMQSALSYLNVPMDQDQSLRDKQIRLALSSIQADVHESVQKDGDLRFTGLSAREVIRVARLHKLDYDLYGRGYVQRQEFDGQKWSFYLEP
ncbi:MAG: penicillin-binding protein 2 [Bdellovibrionota bacterium]